MRYVLCYDVSHDRRRTRFFKRLRGHLTPVQESVFEGEGADLGRIEELVHAELDLRRDSVRIYRLCAGCARAIRLLGVSAPVTDGGDPLVF